MVHAGKQDIELLNIAKACPVKQYLKLLNIVKAHIVKQDIKLFNIVKAHSEKLELGILKAHTGTDLGLRKDAKAQALKEEQGLHILLEGAHIQARTMAVQ